MSISSKPYSAMTRHELLAEIESVQQVLGADRSLLDVVQEGRVQLEEIEAQQAQLLVAQHALEESRDRYADLYDFAPIAFATLDASGLVVEANLAAAQLLGVERGRLVGLPLLVHVSVPDRRSLLAHLQRCRGGDEPVVRSRVRMRAKGDGEVQVDLVSRAARSDPATTWYTALLDLSESERAEEERRAIESERLRLQHEEHALRTAAATKDRFLAVLSHELRTPLTPILFKLAALDARGAVPEDLREPLAVIRRNIEHEARLIDDLLDTTRIVQGKLRLEERCVDVHALIEELVETVATELQLGGLEVRVALHAREHHVRGDDGRLRQMLWNLIVNAQRHTPAGGSLELATTSARPGCLTIRVGDSGSGIEPAVLGRIFEPFEQGDGEPRGGLGLGLAISKGIVDAHHGRIEAHSDGPGRGTTIVIELDTIASGDAAERPAEAAAPSEQGLRILLVEDHPDSAESLAELLRLCGHRVELALSCGEALAHDGASFDLLITDVGLPDGDGVGLLAQLDHGGKLCGIALSGFGTTEDVARSKAAGFADHLTKPIGIDELLAAIDKVVRARPGSRARGAGA